MDPDRDTLSNAPCLGYMTARDHWSMLKSGVTEGGKNTASSCHWLPVFFVVNKHNNTMKPQAKKQQIIFKLIPEGKQQQVEVEKNKIMTMQII